MRNRTSGLFSVNEPKLAVRLLRHPRKLGKGSAKVRGRPPQYGAVVIRLVTRAGIGRVALARVLATSIMDASWSQM